MKLTTFGFAVFAIAIAAAPASALDITNYDDKEYNLTIISGQGDGAVTNLKIEAEGTLENLCEAGCTIKLDNGVTEHYSGEESIGIEEGELVTYE